ncbi:MAG TPA: pilus assembly protein PilP [Candidatus Binatia bacterium]|jgi:type IV pilus assembly protein PilP|nr:pilus assembly protein PilP [Candidatus Binatia bacterium]
MSAHRSAVAVVAIATAFGVSAVRADPAPPAAPQQVLAVEPAGDAPYDPTGRRDPFRPPSVGSGRHSDGPRTPLQRYEIGQLKLVAIIYDTKEPRAVLEDDDGLGYIVKVGTPVGLNDGQVRKIERGRVVIEESSVDFYGEAHPNDIVLELRTAERGK